MPVPSKPSHVQHEPSPQPTTNPPPLPHSLVQDTSPTHKMQFNNICGDKDDIMRKLNYMIQLLEEHHDERTGHVTEEVLLYSFLGVFIIFVIDSFARAGKYVR